MTIIKNIYVHTERMSSQNLGLIINGPFKHAVEFLRKHVQMEKTSVVTK